MDRENSSRTANPYWYERSGAIEHWFYGVFEGGGAKGVAFTGALLAMSGEKCWFRAVAGASAGAITAALVASGLAPQELDQATDDALKNVRTGIWGGLRGLRKRTGYFPSSGLRDWLDTLLKAQVSRKNATRSDTPVTFEELYAATQIELNVVAADLSVNCHVVFSHIETPKCSVAEAVVASSSIPFAFPSRLLRVPDRTHGVTHHTIVDGGVWSNFPMFVFEDEAFRMYRYKYYGRVPDVIEPRRILGFLLHEGLAQVPPRGDDIEFTQEVPSETFRAEEWIPRHPAVEAPRPGLGASVGAWLLYPFSLLGRFVESNGGVERGRWPTPDSKLIGNLVHSVDGLLGGIYPPLLGLFVCLVVGLGSWSVISFMVGDQLRVIPETDWTHPMSYAARLVSVLLTLLGVSLATLVFFVTLLGVVANSILLRAMRRILYGLVTTYVAGSGAPVWAVVEKRNIVALPIPPTVTTLSFEMSMTDRTSLIESARKATLAKLAELLLEDRGALPTESTP